ncbi:MULTISPECIES: ANTAR domain-containing protein [Streptomyces]|uniref:ANTAR domain-containing protein n=1 Tax=Streptomyces TaxID=1883 RepID=UPI0029AA2143|nr:ANTAR domain-containing protein [Streptomyces sp. WI03-4A]MDX2595099.1 ANTAR domain-containing protein [Streptomyces sp. WI03-4A]
MTSAARAPHGGRLNALVVGGRTEEGRALLDACGELVRGCTDTLSAALDALPEGITGIELDMSGVSFMDTAGLEFLDALAEYGRLHGIPVAVSGWWGQPRRVLELVGLDVTDPLGIALAAGVRDRTGSAVALERAEQLRELREEIEQLRHAIDSRPVIDQARGILMAAHGCGPERAWDILREASQRSNTKLREVAAAVTASTAPEGPVPPEELRTALRAAVARHAPPSGGER